MRQLYPLTGWRLIKLFRHICFLLCVLIAFYIICYSFLSHISLGEVLRKKIRARQQWQKHSKDTPNRNVCRVPPGDDSLYDTAVFFNSLKSFCRIKCFWNCSWGQRSNVAMLAGKSGLSLIQWRWTDKKISSLKHDACDIFNHYFLFFYDW